MRALTRKIHNLNWTGATNNRIDSDFYCMEVFLASDNPAALARFVAGSYVFELSEH